MKRSYPLLALVLVLTACGSGEGGGDTATSTTPVATTTTSIPTTSTALAASTTQATAFPVTVEADNGPVTIAQAPAAIISLSSTATEMLFAIDAGDQVVAVDDQSNYPEEAPTTDMSAFTPNVEAILSYQPDLVIVYYDPGDLVSSLEAADVPVLSLGAAVTLDDTYRQIETLGTATGHLDEAEDLNAAIAADLAEVVAGAPDTPDGTTYYHEVDNTFFSATSASFIGQLYSMFDLENIADPADEDGSAYGYPQLSSEYIVAADPDLIFLADAPYGESAETVGSRPGWDVLTAVQEGNVVELDADVSSRWGPRVVDFAQSVSNALGALVSGG